MSWRKRESQKVQKEGGGRRGRWRNDSDEDEGKRCQGKDAGKGADSRRRSGCRRACKRQERQ
jgi:hypothetical protein